MHRSTSFVRRACAVGTATALIGLTTGFGVMTATTAYADDAPTGTSSTSAPVAGADAAGTGTTTPGSDATTPSGDATAPAAPSLPSDGATSAPGTTTGGDAAGTGATTPTTGTASPAPTRPTTSKPSATSPAEAAPTAPAPAAAATATVTISGSAKVGGKLTAELKGFTKPSSFSFTWAVDGVETDDDGPTYTVQAADLGKVVRVTVLNSLRDGSTESASATSAMVGADPQFAAPTSENDPLVISTVAGERIDFDLTGTGSPAPTYTLDWFSADDAEWADEDWSPDGQLPDHTRFVDGHLVGAPRAAYPSTFKVTATNEFGSASEWVEIDVVAAAPAGIEVFTADEAAFEHDPTVKTRAWIIEPNGKVSTFKFESDPDDDGSVFGSLVRGGQPTIEQGHTLMVSGDPVDRFGNYTDLDEDGTPAMTSVTSDVASDGILTNSEYGDYGVRPTEVSTHHISVSQGTAPTTFALVVTAAPAPAAAPPVATPPVSAPPVVTPPVAAAPIGTVPVRTAAHGRLAYTGSDATDSLPWALGMLAAGAALVGLRIVRRRAQR